MKITLLFNSSSHWAIILLMQAMFNTKNNINNNFIFFVPALIREIWFKFGWLDSDSMLTPIGEEYCKKYYYLAGVSEKELNELLLSCKK